MKIGFIGLGNMAGAMLEGMLKKGVVEKQDVIGSDRAEETIQRVSGKFGIETTLDNKEVAKSANILFLCVKPQFLEQVIEEIKEKTVEDTVIVSIVAGKTIEWMETSFQGKRKIIRTMPNTPALVGEGCTAVCGNKNVTEEESDRVLQLLSSFGKVHPLPEKLMNAAIGVSGSSPAYVFLFIEALADGAVAAGISRKQAYEMAAQTVLGSARMVLETGMHPGELKDMVCSPGGTTIEGVKTLEKKGMRSAVLEAVEACVEKAKTL